MSESVYERDYCGLCGRRLTARNCDWRCWPGLCLDCAPDSLFIRARHDAQRKIKPSEDEWGGRRRQYARVWQARRREMDKG